MSTLHTLPPGQSECDATWSLRSLVWSGVRFADFDRQLVMAHDRARVALEERGRGLPGWLLRRLYQPLTEPTARQFARALEARKP
jgi:hypothetical protein